MHGMWRHRGLDGHCMPCNDAAMFTFKHLADFLGSRSEAERVAGIRNKYRAHRLYHGAPHEVAEIEAIAKAFARIASAPTSPRTDSEAA